MMMLATLTLLSMSAAAPDKDMSTLLSCYFEQARVGQTQNLAPAAFEAGANSACQAQQAAAEQATVKRLVDSGRAPAMAREEAAEAVRQARAAMVKVYSARSQAK